MNALAARRRHPAAVVILLLLALLLTGTAYAAFAPKPAEAAGTVSAAEYVDAGKKLFVANCASCHGLNAEGKSAGNGDQIVGPALAGVGAAAVDFQMGTGRMPMAAPGVQAGRNHVLFTEEQISQIGAYVASLGAGPAVPSEEDYDYSDANPAEGQMIFSVNCAMCHNSAGAGGALTRGKYAPSLMDVDPKHIYEAMETGPQSMPVFNDANLDAQAKRDVIAYLKNLEESPTPGGLRLGSLGPVPEGMFAWIFGLGILVGCAVWLGKKAA